MAYEEQTCRYRCPHRGDQRLGCPATVLDSAANSCIPEHSSGPTEGMDAHLVLEDHVPLIL